MSDALARNTQSLLDHLQKMKQGKPSDERRLLKIVENRQYIWHRLQERILNV